MSGAGAATIERIVNHIVANSGTTSVGLTAAAVGLSPDTVRKYVRTLIATGRIEIGHDGQQLEATLAELNERATDARVRSHR